MLAADVMISEIMYHPVSGLAVDDWVEIHNAGDAPAELIGWRFTDGVDFQFPAATLDAGAYLVIAADPVRFAADYPGVTNVLGPWSGRLSNSAERITLVTALGVEVDSVRYADQGDWSTRLEQLDEWGFTGWIWADEHDGGGKSLELINPALGNEQGQNWDSSTPDGGTPGEPNSIAAADIAPMILDVGHWPVIPHSDDPVTVSATIVDELTTGLTVTLSYRLDGTVPFTTIDMADGGGGFYSAQLPPQADGTIVEFYLTAIDAGANLRTYPAAIQPMNEQLANLLYQVDDSFDPEAPWDPTARPIFRLIMTDAERQELATLGEDYPECQSDAQMNGTLITLDGVSTEVRYTVGIRNRGHGSRDNLPHNYRVNIRSDTPWHDVSAVNLNAQYGYSQVAGAAILASAGFATADATAAQVRINNDDPTVGYDTRTYGLYAYLEALNSDFTDSRFPDDPAGNLYKALRLNDNSEQADLRYEGPDPDPYRDTYFKNTNEAEDDWSDLIGLTDVLNHAPDETFLTDLEQVMDVRRWLRFIALHNLLSNRETGLNMGIGDDYVMYRGTIDTRFVPVAHDLDSLMGVGGTGPDDIFGAADAGSFERLLTHPQTVAIFYAEYLDLIETVLAPDVVGPLLDNLLGGWVDEGRIDSMKQSIDTRIASVLSQIPREFTAEADGPLVGGYYRSTQPIVPVGGTADAASTRSVLVDGEPAEWDARAGAWSYGAGGTETHQIVAPGSTWSYLDDGSNQAAAWRAPAFDDSLWAAGPAQLGYGDGDEDTVVGYGPDRDNKYATTYFRHAFSLADASIYSGLTLRMVFDDAVAVYLNGVEVVRRNLISTAGYNTYGSQQTQENNWFSYTIDPATLVDGDNVLAVEIHQASPTSSDISFDLELEGTTVTPATGGVSLSPGINRVEVRAFDGPDGTGELLHTGYIDVWYDTGVTNDYPKTGQDPPDPTEEVLTVRLSAPTGYMPGRPAPVRVELVGEDGRIHRETWDATATLTVDDPGVVLSTTQIDLRNGLGSALVTFTGGTDFTLTADVDGTTANRSLVDMSAGPVTDAAGTLAGTTTDWSGIIHVTGDLLVPVGHTLTVQPGTWVLIDGVGTGTEGVDIDVQGTLQSLGADVAPVVFTAYDPAAPWGEIHHSASDPALYQYTFINLGGNSPHAGHSGSGPVMRIENSSATLDHVTVSDNPGKIMQATGSDLTIADSHLARSAMGPEIEATALALTDTFITEMYGPNDNDGLYIHSQLAGQDVTLTRLVIADVDDDGLDTLRSDIDVVDFVTRDCFDKGVSIYGGVVNFDRMISVNNDIGISAKEQDPGRPGPVVTVDHATIVGDSMGVQAEDKFGVPNLVVEYWFSNSIIVAPDPIRTDYDPGDIHVHYSNVGESWTGLGNINLDPQFVDAAAGDYHLSAGSPSIDAGDPTDPLDPDLSVTDQGYYAYEGGASPGGDTLLVDTTWTAGAGPYLIAGELTVGAGVTLTVEPGATVFFAPAARLTVAGRLLAEGTADALIHFTRMPSAGGAWNGIQFASTTEDNRIAHAVLEYGNNDDGMIGLDNSRLTIENAYFDHTDLRRIRSIDSALIVRDSIFADIFAFGEAPTTNNRNEHIWGGGIPAGGEWIIEGNYFGVITGHNDAIDFDGPFRPDPVAQILNNVFAGGGDDALDLETDAHIEGNVFMHYHKDVFNTDTGQSNVISAGSGHEFVVVRNIFFDMDHVSLIKEDSFMTFVNNTVIDSDYAALYFDLAGETDGPGRGAYVDGSIFADVAEAFGEVLVTTDLTVNRSLVDEQWHSYGTGNIDAAANFVDPEGDWRLLPVSAAIDAGSNGLDMGAHVPAGASIGGMRRAVTRSTDAILTFDGPGVTAIKYRIDGGAWSDEMPAGTTVAWNDLSDGQSYTVEAIGRNSAGVWQAEADATALTWTIDSTLSRLIINEVLATGDDAQPDAIELFNDSAATVDLGGMGLTDDPGWINRFVFPAGTTIGPTAYLVVFANDPDGTGGIHTGFGLAGSGEGVYLYDSIAHGATLIDSVEFGPQLPGYTLGRAGADDHWTLTLPTLGAPNIAQPLDDPRGLLINEWFTRGDVTFDDDFLELYNPQRNPVDVGGMYLTDNPITQPAKHQLPPLSFAGGEAMMVLTPDGNTDAGGDHLGFGLSPYREMIALYDPSGAMLDWVIYGAQTTDVAQGRSPDGGDTFAFFPLPTPGAANPADLPGATVNTDVIEFDQVWSYEQSGTDLGTAWRDPAYDDSAWPAGRGLLYVEGSSLPGPKNTPLTLGELTYYFRTHFTFNGDPADVTELEISSIFDDGAVVYLNGVEVLRFNMPGGTITHTTLADSTINNAGVQGPFAIPTDNLLAGDNVLAVEVHQRGSTSSDIVMGLAMDAVSELPPITNDLTNMIAILEDLRITELMYHPVEDVEVEFLELLNTGSTDLDLTGVRISDGIDFEFPPMTLGGGDYVVVTNDAAGFVLKYGSAVNLAGQYSGRLANGDDDIVLQLPVPYDAAALRFTYEDGWQPSTDGGGPSLIIADAAGSRPQWRDPASWLAGATVGGTPGSTDPAATWPMFGDWTEDSVVDAADIDELAAALRTGSTNVKYDVTGDHQLPGADMDYLVDQLVFLNGDPMTRGTRYGDADLNGAVDLEDFVALKLNFAVNPAGGWAGADFNGDGAVDLEDFVLLKQNWGTAATAPAASVEVMIDELATETVARRSRAWRSGAHRRRITADRPGIDAFDLLAITPLTRPIRR